MPMRGEVHPFVFRLRPNVITWLWKVWVIKATRCNPCHSWKKIGLEKHRRATVRTKARRVSVATINFEAVMLGIPELFDNLAVFKVRDRPKC